MSQGAFLKAVVKMEESLFELLEPIFDRLSIDIDADVKEKDDIVELTYRERLYEFELIVEETKKKSKKPPKYRIIYNVFMKRNKRSENYDKFIGRSYIRPEEIELVNHVAMSYPILLHHFANVFKLNEENELIPIKKGARRIEESGYATQSAEDTALRLHLIIAGDIYQDNEMVFYRGAGCQIASDYMIAF